MPALNFIARLAPAVEAGTKRQTVRRVRKHPIKAGDPLYLYTGMRTKHCRKLKETTCRSVARVRVEADRMLLEQRVGLPDGGTASTMVELHPDDADAFAREDGLRGFDELHDWLRENYGLPFEGVVYYWD